MMLTNTAIHLNVLHSDSPVSSKYTAYNQTDLLFQSSTKCHPLNNSRLGIFPDLVSGASALGPIHWNCFLP